MTDQSHPPITHLFACIACWAVEQGMPPASFWQGETDEWTVTINATDLMEDGLPPKSMKIEHKVYMAVGLIHARGGWFVGPPEEEIIAHFNGLLNTPVEAVA